MAKRDINSILVQPEKTSKPKTPDELSKTYDLSPEVSKKVSIILRTPKTNIVSDSPVNKDSLGFNSMVRTISNIVLSQNTQTPLSICIDGEWGSGKTSILKMIEAQAKIIGFHSIWLNAWNLGNTDDFITTVGSELHREFRLHERDKGDLRGYVKEWKTSPLSFGFGTLVRYLLRIESNNLRLANNPILRKKITELQEQWDLLSEKLKKLQRVRILSTDTAERFTIEKELERVETERKEIEQRLSDLDPLNQNMEQLQEQWDLLSEKLARLEREKILETRSEERLYFEKKITELKAERQKIEQYLNYFETQVSPETITAIDSAFTQDSYRSHRLIIFVDDIDRAFPDQIAMTLKNLKLILESSNCVFILAMDMDIVSQSIETYYRQQTQSLVITQLSNIESAQLNFEQKEQSKIAKEFGYSYLEKLVQIRIEVPPLTWNVVNIYLKESGIVDDVIEIIKWAPDEEILNPRRLKRYINWLSILLQLITAVPMPAKISNLIALRTIALRYDYPEIYNSLIQGSDVDDAVLNQISIKRGDDQNSFKMYIANFPKVDELVQFEEFLYRTPLLNARRR